MADDGPSAKKGKEPEGQEEARPISGDERVEKTKVSGETDLFDQVLFGKSAEKLRDVVERVDNEIAQDDDKDFEEDDGDEEEDFEEPEETDGAKDTEDEEEPIIAPKKKEKRQAKKSGKTEGKKDAEEENAQDDGSDDEEYIDEEPGENEGEAKNKADPQENAQDWADDEFDYDVDHYAKEPDELKKPVREDIRRTIIEKAEQAAENAPADMLETKAEKLQFLSDEAKKSVFIGRKLGIYKKYGFEGALHIGRVQEKELEDWEVYLDSLNPHVVFVCGARGSGKSYVLGVIAEELAEKNRNVGIIVVDPIGVFWSMRFANKDEKELEKLNEWGLHPRGLGNIKVFIPEGMKGQVPKSTYDAGFAIQPSLLTSEDWALTFGVDRFSISGLLLDKVIKKVEKGYKKVDAEEGKVKDRKVDAKGKNYSLEDLIECLEFDSELNSREKGYKQDSIRAIVSRFEAAKSWGIFHEKGTPLGELSREGQLTILDTSFLEDNVTALVIGILARRLLAARKVSTRKEAANKFKSLNMNELLELEVPPTWLFIDEAHTLIPSGNEVTAATAGLIEYVKQGRRPGLSLVFATQQPSAINTKVLSQLDIIMTHKLIFDDDIKAVFKRTPTIIPRKFRSSNFIKTLPVGVAVTGDRREETNRAFVMGIRPRKSQHEGRDAETTGMAEQIDSTQAGQIALEMLLRNVKDEKYVDMERAKLAIDTLNTKYNGNINLDKILDQLAQKGFIVSDEGIYLKGFAKKNAKEKPEKDEEAFEEDELELQNLAQNAQRSMATQAAGEEPPQHQAEKISREAENIQNEIELLSLPQRIDERTALRIANSARKKSFLGLFGKTERIEDIQLRHLPIWRLKLNIITNKREFVAKDCFVNSLSGEFVHFKGGNFLESKGLPLISSLSDEELLVFRFMQGRNAVIEQIMANTNLDEARVTRILNRLMESRIAERKVDGNKKFYTVSKAIDMPPSQRNDLLDSLAVLPFTKTEALNVERERVSKEDAANSVRKLWPNVLVKRSEVLYKPVWFVALSAQGKRRHVLVDAVNGKIMD